MEIKSLIPFFLYFLIVVGMGIYTPGFSPRGVSEFLSGAGIISGAIVVITWKLIPILNGMIYELIPAVIVSSLITIVVSLLSKNKV